MTQSLVESLADIKSDNYEVRFAMLLSRFEVYSIPFSRQNAILIFGSIPATFSFRDYNKFQCEKCIFQPETMADYISIVKSMGLSLRPDEQPFRGFEESRTKEDKKYRETIEKATYYFKRR